MSRRRLRLSRGVLLSVGFASGSFACAQLVGLDEDFHEVDAETSGDGDGDGLGGNGDGDGDGDGDTERPALPKGRLVFHRAKNYEDWDAKMFIAELPEGKLSEEIGAKFGICSPISGQLSPDGAWLAVVALPKSGDCGGGQRDQSEIFLLDVSDLDGSAAPMAIRLTNNVNRSDEDPTFGPTGDRLYIKHDNRIVSLPIEDPQSFVDEPFIGCDESATRGNCLGAPSGTERSKPTVDQDGKTLCYSTGNFAEGRSNIYCLQLDSVDESTDLDNPDNRDAVVVDDSISYARPVIFGEYIYYRHWWGPDNQDTILSRKRLSALASASEQAAFYTDSNGTNYTDPAGLREADALLVFTTNEARTEWNDLYVARFLGEQTWSIDELTTDPDGAINSTSDGESQPHFVALP